jgi:transcriptional regulator with XRE-family HTH domain
MKVSELARNTKIGHATLDRWIAGDFKTSPRLDALNRLATYTRIDLCDMVEFFYPQPSRSVDPDTFRLAESIGQLPVEGKEMIDAIILGLSLKRNK